MATSGTAVASLSDAQRATLERMSKLRVYKLKLSHLPSDALGALAEHLDWESCCALLATAKRFKDDPIVGPALREHTPFARIRVLQGDSRYRIIGANGERQTIIYDDPESLYGATFHYVVDGVRYVDMKRDVTLVVDYVRKIKRDAPLIRNLRIQHVPGEELPFNEAFEYGPGVPHSHAATPEFQKEVDAAFAAFQDAQRAFDNYLAQHPGALNLNEYDAQHREARRLKAARDEAKQKVPTGSLPPDHIVRRGPAPVDQPTVRTEYEMRLQQGWYYHEGTDRLEEPLDPMYEYRRMPLPVRGNMCEGVMKRHGRAVPRGDRRTGAARSRWR